jgi:hypothetical protein
MLKAAVRDAKRRNISQKQQAGMNQLELNNHFRHVAEIEEAMRTDQSHVEDMNRRIIDDFTALEKQRSLQVQKLVYSYARASFRAAQKTNDVFFMHAE